MIHSTLRVMLRRRHRLWRPHHVTSIPCRMFADFGSSDTQSRPRQSIKPYAAKITKPASKQYDEPGNELVSLDERVEQLGLCSRGKANRLLEQAEHFRNLNDPDLMRDQLKEVIYLKKQPVYHTGVAVSPDETDIEIQPGMPIRLSKRMSELEMCSKREAAGILKASECVNKKSLMYLERVVYLRGEPVMDGAAVKIPPLETHIEIRSGDDPPDEGGSSKDFRHLPYSDRPWEEIQGDTVVLNKPIGYVSGQEEHQHVPAVRLLTRGRLQLDHLDYKEQIAFSIKGSALHFEEWKFAGFNMMANSVPKHVRETLSNDKLREKSEGNAETLTGYAVAGRLDIDSTGVLIFTRAGIMARRLIEHGSCVQKEYIVKVQPAMQPSRQERERGLMSLPAPTKDLSILLRRGNYLLNERFALKPLKVAEWLDDCQNGVGEGGGEQHQNQTLSMRLVLVEGKKRQIRRMCRELLGWHVVELVRTAVGPVRIDSLPEGRWRPLTQKEVKSIFEPNPEAKKKRQKR